MNGTLEERFWAKVDVRDPDECWEWTAATTRGDYGRIHDNGRMRKAHRVSWEFANGAIPEGLCVLHDCDNPPCVNPAHLHLGTQSDNIKEAFERGRCEPPVSNGEKNGQAKLTRGDVIAIRELYATGAFTQKELGEMFAVTRRNIGHIVNYRSWAHVDDQEFSSRAGT